MSEVYSVPVREPGNYPLRVLPFPARIALTYVLPVAFIGYLPAAVLTRCVGSAGVLPWLAVGWRLVGLGLYVLARYVWFLGLRSYDSAGKCESAGQPPR